MEGDARARRCAACDRVVHDLSAHTHAGAVELLLRCAGTRACMRVGVDANGAIVLADGVLADVPVLGESSPSAPAKRFARPIAAAALGAALAGCTPHQPACGYGPQLAVISEPHARAEATPAHSASVAPPPAVIDGGSDGAGASDAGVSGAAAPGACPDGGSAAAAQPGCARKVVVVSQGIAIVMPEAHFAWGSTKPDAESTALLDEVANVMKTHPEIQLVHVEGHATPDERDPRGLSEARAEAVIRELVRRGIDRGRLDARGFGADRPIEPNDSPAHRARNRRIELRAETPP